MNRHALSFAKHAISRDLRRKRLAAGLSQGDLSRRCGIRVEILSRLESGHANPTVRTVSRILKALGER